MQMAQEERIKNLRTGKTTRPWTVEGRLFPAGTPAEERHVREKDTPLPDGFIRVGLPRNYNPSTKQRGKGDVVTDMPKGHLDIS